MPSIWHPSGFLKQAPERPYALLLLNQPINKNVFLALLDSAAYLVCADAGGDRLLAMERDLSLSIRLPDVIIGDLDSISEEAKEYYAGKGVSVVREPDQYSTDFAKALKWIRGQCNKDNVAENALDVVVLGGLGGRVDQGFSQIHHLYKAEQDTELLCGRIYLLSEQNITFILDEGDNVIYIEPGTFSANVGIIPVMGPTRISTQGFEWDVEDWLTEFGGQLSTSNHLQCDKILLNVNGRKPMMTIELAERFCVAH